jgi:hypothetical protein
VLNPCGAGERDDGVRAEIRGRQRCAVLRHVTGGSDHDAAHRAHAGRNRRAFRRRADAHRDVEPLLHQVDRPIDQAERDRHLGETPEKLGHDRKHMQAPEQDRRGDAQFAARRGALAGRGPFDLLEIGKHAARARQKPVPSLRKADRAGGTIEKPHPEPRFQFPDRARNRGGGASEPARSRRKTAAFGDFDENRDALDATHLLHISQ